MPADRLLLLAYQHRQAKRLSEAETLCRQILASNPNHCDALYLLGLIASDCGAYEPAAGLIERSLSLSPGTSLSPKELSAMYYTLGYVKHMAGKDREAIVSYDESLKLQPDYVDAYINKGVLLRRLAADQEAINTYIKAIQVAPHIPATYYNLGNALRDIGKMQQAVACFEKAIELLAKTTKEISLKAAAHNNLGQIFADMGNHKQAIAHFEQAIVLVPDGCETYHNYANVLRDQGRREECLAMYAKALALKPLYPEARWARAMAYIPLLGSEGEILSSRALFDKELEDLHAWFDEDRISLGAAAVGVSQPFYLAYQEHNNQPLLAKYGRLCTKLMLDWADKRRISLPSQRESGALRLGIVSSHFHDHSVWHAITKGWMRHLDRSKIDIHVFYIDHLIDEETRWAEAHAASFQKLSLNLDAAVLSILSKKLDVLIYPEIGMAPTAMKLASLRLCSVQMTSWGHPETSGLPTMDYYLSAEDFEPAEADAYYAEKLVRLPHLGSCYQPLDLPEKTVDLKSIGLNPDLPILLSPGMVFKYAAENDHVFIDIVHKLGPCQIVFFVGRLDVLSEKFEARLQAAFTAAGLDFEAHCLFIPWQDRASFYSLLRQATVFLDTIGFSGFNTAIQAIECSLPVVTRKGRFMRGRLATGILSRMDLMELVTNSNAAYVDKVVEVVTDSDYRRSLRDKIVSRRHVLFEDQAPIEFLEQFLMSRVALS